ncbi:MAG: RNA repair transcriptional activator RtcR [Pseudomonadota bacterium]|nr:RNA repair transcriptional activator RtcR [Pseudomonadota bacterium]
MSEVPAAKPIVVIGFLGTVLDAGYGAKRWHKWRPTVSLVQQPGAKPARVELLMTRAETAPERLRDYARIAQRVQEDMAELSPGTQVRTHMLDIANPWDFGAVYGALYDWASAYPFAPEREQYWAHITTGTHVAQICLFLLAESRRLPALLAQTSPPRQQKEGQVGTLTLIDLDLSRYDALARRFEAAQQDAVAFLKSGIATRNARFNALIEEIERVAVRSTAPILLVGPTGAGKSFLARRMADLKRARKLMAGAFVEVNCATLHGEGAMSVLFGHKKGAFTGAASDRAGLLKSADGGVLFLDEIGELGLDEQAMLLKAIEEKRFYPLGSDREVSSAFQLIAGTHRDLRREVAAGRFREDLFARINLWTYDLPGLAERAEDIEPNIDHLLALYAAEHHQVVRFHPEARQDFLQFAQSPQARWRGNFRDLSASITRLATLAEGGRISRALVQAEIARLQWLWARDEEAGPAAEAAAAADGQALVQRLLGAEGAAALDAFDRLQLAAVLPVVAASRSLSDAGRKLFAQSRQQRKTANDADRLRKYLLRFGLTWEQVRAEAQRGGGAPQAINWRQEHS